MSQSTSQSVLLCETGSWINEQYVSQPPAAAVIFMIWLALDVLIEPGGKARLSSAFGSTACYMLVCQQTNSKSGMSQLYLLAAETCMMYSLSLCDMCWLISVSRQLLLRGQAESGNTAAFRDATTCSRVGAAVINIVGDVCRQWQGFVTSCVLGSNPVTQAGYGDN